MTPVFALCDDYVTRSAELDPVTAGMQGLTSVFAAATDYSPDGFAARADLISATLAALGPMSIISDADRLAAGFLRERLEAQLAWYQLDEPLRLVRAPIGLISAIRDSVDLLPRDGDGAWRADLLASLPAAIRTRVLRRAAIASGCPPGTLAARHIEALDSLVTSWHGQRWTDLPGGIRGTRHYGKLLFTAGDSDGPAGAEKAEGPVGRE